MSLPKNGFVGARSYDQAIFEEQSVLELWRQHIVATYTLHDTERGTSMHDLTSNERQAVLYVTSAEKFALRCILIHDGIEGPHTRAIRALKRKIS